MKKYLVNTWGNHWEACDSVEDAAQRIIEEVDDFYLVDTLKTMEGGDEEDFLNVSIRCEEVCDEEEEV